MGRQSGVGEAKASQASRVSRANRQRGRRTDYRSGGRLGVVEVVRPGEGEDLPMRLGLVDDSRRILQALASKARSA
jgi:hypothetical protein